MKTTAYAYVDADGIDVDSIAEKPDLVQDKILESCLGWRYRYPEDKAEKWQHLRAVGEIREIEISIKQE